MTTKVLCDSIKKLSSSCVDTACKCIGRIRRLLTFNLADGMVPPQRDILVSIHQGRLLIAVGRRFLSRIRIEKYRECALPEGTCPTPDIIVSELAMLIDERRTNRSPITISIPKAWTVVRTVDLPAAAKEHLSDVVSYELDRLTPLSSTNAFFDFMLLKEKDGRLFVTVAAARRDFIAPYLDALETKGFPVRRIILQSSGMAQLVDLVAGCENALYLIAEDEDYELGHVVAGTVSHAVNGRFEAGNEHARRMEEVAREISAILDRLKRQSLLPGVCVIVLNGTDGEKLAAKAPLPLLRMADAEIARHFSTEIKGISHLALGGLLECLRPKARALNLLSKGRHKTAGMPAMVTTILLLALAVLGVLQLVAPLQIERRKLQGIEQQIALRKDEMKRVVSLQRDIDALKGEIDVIADFEEKHPSTLAIINELTAIVPKTSWLSRIRIATPTVDIEGFSSVSPAEFLPNIEASPLFRKGEFAGPTVRDSTMKADRFVMKMELRRSGKEEEKGIGHR